MRYSVPVMFHVDADNKELAGNQVDSVLDFLFGMHWQELQAPGTYIANAVTLHQRIAGPHDHIPERYAGSVAGA